MPKGTTSYFNEPMWTEIALKDQALWLDVVEPSPEDLHKLSSKYSLHQTSVEDCLDPEHLPKIERFQNFTFLILRAYDQNCPAGADSIQEMTRKVAIFVGEKVILSLHRKDQPFLAQLRDKFKALGDQATVKQVLSDLMVETVMTFEKPVDQAFVNLENLETGVFRSGKQAQDFLEDAYYLKRTASIIRRLIRLSLDVQNRAVHVMGESPFFQDAREEAERLYFYADELVESITDLVDLHVSVETKRANESGLKTNEVMRFLTVFSALFLPLNFIASVYGMNFEHMPELSHPYGYYTVLSLMILLGGGIFVWFYGKGWLKRQ